MNPSLRAWFPARLRGLMRSSATPRGATVGAMPGAPTVAEVALAGLVTAVATGIGALPVGRADARAFAWKPVLLGAAAAAMTVVSILGLLLPALDDGSPGAVAAGLALGVGFLLGVRAFLQRRGMHDVRLSSAGNRRAVLVVLVLFVHSLPEGFAIGSAWASETEGLGVFVVVAIALQNIPEGTVTAIPLALAGAGRARQFWVAVGTSLPQPIGAVIAFAARRAGRCAAAGLVRVRGGRDALARGRRRRARRLDRGRARARLGGGRCRCGNHGRLRAVARRVVGRHRSQARATCSPSRRARARSRGLDRSLASHDLARAACAG